MSGVGPLDPGATLDIEFLWDTDDDGVLNACGPVLLRSITPQALAVHTLARRVPVWNFVKQRRAPTSPHRAGPMNAEEADEWRRRIEA